MSSAIQASNTTSRFALTLIDLLDRVQYRRVSVDEQFDPVYRLRYEAYRRTGGGSDLAAEAQSLGRDAVTAWQPAG